MAFISLFFGSPAQPRIFVTPMVLLIFVGVWLEMNRKTSCEDQYELAVNQFSGGN
ncbi:MAG TPA: hypothetical protein VFC63_27580 [Blastocatellia bacterium]|nr:hypothetical protein [Blastocatellia bacterium]